MGIFWYQIAQSITNKEKTSLVENGKTPTAKAICETLNTSFSDIVKSLGISQYKVPSVDISDIDDPLLKHWTKNEVFH